MALERSLGHRKTDNVRCEDSWPRLHGRPMRPFPASDEDQPIWRCQLALRVSGGAIRPTAVAYCVHRLRLVATLRFGRLPILNTLPTPDCRRSVAFAEMKCRRTHDTVRLAEYVNLGNAVRSKYPCSQWRFAAWSKSLPSTMHDSCPHTWPSWRLRVTST